MIENNASPDACVVLVGWTGSEGSTAKVSQLIFVADSASISVYCSSQLSPWMV